MDLTGFAGSQAPNAIGIGFAVLVAVVALKAHERLRWIYVILPLLFLGTVLMKNYRYHDLVAGAEGSLDAHRSYAGALLGIIVVQVATGACFLFGGMASKRLFWPAMAAGLACGYAAVCMTGWRQVYLESNANVPVRYELWLPLLHWALLVGLVISTVLALVIPALARSRRTTTAP